MSNDGFRAVWVSDSITRRQPAILRILMAFTGINSEDRLVQKTFADHLHDVLGWESEFNKVVVVPKFRVPS